MQKRNILVIGGNRFFGKRLIEMLVASGDHVTVLNRGNLNDGLGDKVDRLVCDRDDVKKLESLMQHKTWDVVYDQVCFDAHQAKSAVEIFANRTKKFIFTSTVSVYDLGKNLNESGFNPYTHSYEKILSRDENYGEAKRQCEAVFFAQNKMPVTAVRFPIVMGPDDYTERLKFYVDKVKNGELIYFPNLEAKMSYIHSADAAEGLFFLGKNNFSGPVNMASAKPLAMRELIEHIEHVVKKKALLHSQSIDGEKSPYGVPEDWYVNVSRISELGFTPRDISEWLDTVISQQK